MEPLNPSGPKPPTHDQGKTESTSAWISPRLREKLMDSGGGTDLPPPKEGPPAWLGIVLAVAVIGGGAGLFMAMRSGAEKDKIAAAKAAEAATADSIAAAAADSVRQAAADTASAARAALAEKTAGQTPPTATKPAAATTKPVATAPPGATKPATPATEPAPVPAARGTFGIEVGSYLVEDRANSEQARLATATGLTGRVVATADDGMFHVVLGSFRSQAAAERAAEPLLAKGLVNEARVVPVKP